MKTKSSKRDGLTNEDTQSFGMVSANRSQSISDRIVQKSSTLSSLSLGILVPLGALELMKLSKASGTVRQDHFAFTCFSLTKLCLKGSYFVS